MLDINTPELSKEDLQKQNAILLRALNRIVNHKQEMPANFSHYEFKKLVIKIGNEALQDIDTYNQIASKVHPAGSKEALEKNEALTLSNHE